MMILRKCAGVVFAVTLVLMMIPAVEANQTVKVEGGQLLTDFDRDGSYTPFVVKGIGYGPVPVGWFYSEWGLCRYTGMAEGKAQFDCPGIQAYENKTILSRDLPLIKEANANTIRTWGKVTPQLLDQCEGLGLKVIAGYWIRHDLDFVNGNMAAVRLDILDYVRAFKDHPAVLMWGIANENEMNFCTFKGAGDACGRDGQAAAFYRFINGTAAAIKELEGGDAHPVMYVSADLGDIGVIASDSTLPAVDIHGCNVYRGVDFGGKFNNFFNQYRQRSAKPLLITEYGIDAWYVTDPEDPSRGRERQDLQAAYVGRAWDTIAANTVSNNGPALGGVVFQYADGWWKYKGEWSPTAASHDYGYTPGFHAGPDGYVNEEWFGIMAVVPAEGLGQIDRVTPRLAYEVVRKKYAP